MSYFNKKRFTMRQVVGLLTFVFLGITVIAYAAMTKPHPDFTPGSTILSGHVNDNFNNLYNAMPAVKSATTTAFTIVSSTTPVNILSLPVTPPVDGYIILNGSGTLGRNGATSARNYVEVYLTTTSGGSSLTNYVIFVADGTDDSWVPLNITGVFPVTGGVTTTFYMTASRDAFASNTLYVGNTSSNVRLTATFVPGTALP